MGTVYTLGSGTLVFARYILLVINTGRLPDSSLLAYQMWYISLRGGLVTMFFCFFLIISVVCVSYQNDIKA